MDRRRLRKLTSVAVASAGSLPSDAQSPKCRAAGDLWSVWNTAFSTARFVSLSHVLTPHTPLWEGLPPDDKVPARDRPARRPFAVRRLHLREDRPRNDASFATDPFGTQLDPPAHWHPCFPAVDELPPTLALRKLAVISIADKVKADPNYHLSAADVQAWERRHGTVPSGSVVMVRSDWPKRWSDGERLQPADHKFPRRHARGAQAAAPRPQDPAAQPRAARHRFDAHPDRRRLADEQRLHAGRRRVVNLDQVARDRRVDRDPLSRA